MDLFSPPPKAPRPYREGLRREHAKDARDANYAEHKATGGAALQRDELVAIYAQADIDHGVTDKEAATRFRPPIPASTVSARRNELLKANPEPLVEKAGEKRPCDVTGRTVQPWQLTAAGWDRLRSSYLAEMEANR